MTATTMRQLWPVRRKVYVIPKGMNFLLALRRMGPSLGRPADIRSIIDATMSP
jgi:hypothetical protein